MIHYSKILAIKISHGKGKEREYIQEGTLKENWGLEEDAYSKPGDREVCLITQSSSKSKQNYQDGLCVKRFSETILIDTDPKDISVGDLLDFDGVRVEITTLGKKCYPECAVIQNKKTCPLATELMFGKVVQGGKIKVCN